MKKILILAITFTILISSCTDFLDKEERGIENLENYFLTKDQCENYTSDLIKRLLSPNNWWPLIAPRVTNEMATDDAWMGNTDPAPDQGKGNHIDASQYTIDPINTGAIKNFYQYHFETIRNCNVAISGMTNSPLSSSIKNRYIGEALFVRAYCYNELVNNYGGVPLITAVLGTNDLLIPRSTDAQIYSQIETDLLESATKIGNTGVKGRITQWAAFALLSRVSMYQGRKFDAAPKWAQAKLYANKVIAEGGFTLESDFKNIWSVNNRNGVESILEAQSSSDQVRELGSYLPTMSGARGEEGLSDTDKVDGWGWCMPTSDLENAYLSENDIIRRRSTITKYGEAAYGDEVLNPSHKFDLIKNKSGRICRKYYIPIATRRTLVKRSGYLPLNTPLIRLAEMYLIRAEANYHEGSTSEALNDINTIRRRVSLPDKTGLAGSNLLRQIYKERRLELAFEGLRLYDIRTQKDPGSPDKRVIETLMGPTGTFVQYNTVTSTDVYEKSNLREPQDKGKNFDKNKHLVWPIPQESISLSQGTLIQNPNY
jgi:starch-binding outer membrane protein, SusD/RagB family